MEYIKKRDGLGGPNLDGVLTSARNFVSRIFRLPQKFGVETREVAKPRGSISKGTPGARARYFQPELQRLLR